MIYQSLETTLSITPFQMVGGNIYHNHCSME
jgi:hypothetical protein